MGSPSSTQSLESAQALARQGKFAEAEAMLSELRQQAPSDYGLTLELGKVLVALQRLPEGAGMLQEAVKLNPLNPEPYRILTLMLFELRRFAEAEPVVLKWVQIAPDSADASQMMAQCYHALERDDEAILYYQKSLSQQPKNPAVHNNLGSLYRKQQQYDLSESHFMQALKGHDDKCLVYCNLGNTYFAQRRFEEAKSAYEKAIRENAAFAYAYLRLGYTYRNMEQPDKAILQFQKGLALDPNNGEFHQAISLAYRRLGEMDKAISAMEKAVEVDPNNADSHYWLATFYLPRGEYAKGWAEYEWRRKRKGHQGIFFKKLEPWLGEPLAGKTLLVHCEQGLGDTIQFCRLVKHIRTQNPKALYLVVQPELHRLLEASDLPVDRVIPFQKEKLPEGIDYEVPLLSLPHRLGLSESDLAMDGPYVRNTMIVNSFWKASFKGVEGLKVGVVWTGRPTHGFNAQRSIDPALLEPLTTLPGTVWYCLQKDTHAASTPGNWHLLHSGITDFADTAAIVQQLDLVITVDTAVAHLAGALGKPVWVMLDAQPDWRWLEGRCDTPWYPSMTLFRQENLGDWQPVIEQLKAGLESLVRKG